LRIGGDYKIRYIDQKKRGGTIIGGRKLVWSSPLVQGKRKRRELESRGLPERKGRRTRRKKERLLFLVIKKEEKK